MTEAQVGFLYKVAAAVSRSNNEPTSTLLKSYYLMRCKELTRGYGLPDKHFSVQVRCPKCCIEWKKETEVKVQSIKLSKRQRKRLKSRKVKENKKQYVRSKNKLLHSNEVVQICTFCKKNKVTVALKPQKYAVTPDVIATEQSEEPQMKEEGCTKMKIQKTHAQRKAETEKDEVSVYANALDVFSLQNKNNALPTKEKPKVINNNKRKKHKFAGLCEKAVLASAKIKEKRDKQNKLNLFLKPSL